MWARFVLAASLVALICAVVAFLSLLPSYLSIQFSMPPTSDALAKVPVGGSADSAEIAQAQALTNQLGPLLQSSTTPAQVIQSALTQKPNGVSIDHLTFSESNGGGGGQITLSGIAKQPSDISAYRDSLSKDPNFSNVSVPVGALVGSSAGRFTITLSGQF